MEEKTKNKLPIIITVTVLIIILIAGSIGGYLWYKHNKENKTIGTQWGDTYYTYLKESNEKQEIQEGKRINTEIRFIQNEKNQEPKMVMQYIDTEIEDNNSNNHKLIVYGITEGEVKTEQTIEKSTEQNIVFLYHIPTKKYGWYAHTTLENGTQIFENIFDNPSQNIYTFTKEEMPQSDKTIDENNIPIISKFEETFIVPEDYDESIIIKLDGDLAELRDKIKEGIEGYKTIEQIVTENVTQTIKMQTEELENKKQEKERIEEEKRLEEERLAEEARKKAEEKKKAEEEAKKKAQSTTTSTNQSTTTSSNRISEKQAMALAQKIDGTGTPEQPIGYTKQCMVKDSTGLEYYLFIVRWLVDSSHWSTIDAVAISVDGKKWKNVDMHYTEGQTIKQVYKEGNF